MNNYDQLFQKEISELKGRPSLLLHVCCGPCSVYPLRLLNQYFKITILYTNSNIYPYSEYEKRLSELERYVKMLDTDINIVIPKYDSDFQKKLGKFGNYPEGQERCVLCYTLRMKDAFAYAVNHHFDYCTTIMSISNHKNANYINHIGENLEELFDHKVKFLHNDFKKRGGIDKNRELNAQIDLYHQPYCGCAYSLADYHRKLSQAKLEELDENANAKLAIAKPEKQ